MARRIHVQVPAYMDAELEPTLLDLYAKAAQPDLLHTSVLWQRRVGSELASAVSSLPNLDVVACDAAQSQGPNWARRQLRQRWSGEEFTLMIDSHHRFVPRWDELVENLHDELVAAGVERPVLTAYLPPYHPDQPVELAPHVPLRLLPHAWDQGVLSRLVGWPIPFASRRATPMAACLASFHFVFAPGDLNRCLGLDLLDDIYFFGDEVLLALILQSAGYRLFHPHRLIGWHAYERSRREPHWESSPDWSRRHDASITRIRRLIEAAGQPDHPITRDAVDMIERSLMAPLLVA